MADYTSLQSPKENYRQPLSSIFTSPRLFTSFVSKGSLETESLTSPTSIMDTKPFCVLKNPFKSETNSPKPECKNHWDKLEWRGVSLGLIDALIDENSQSNVSKHDSRMVLFGSQLRIHVPPLPPSVASPTDSPKSPCDFGIKTRHSHVGSPSPSPSTNFRRSPFGSINSGGLSSLSASEMELSEDYTCVISYGPNPRTTHIFDDCIVESCCGVVKFSESRKENAFFSMNHSMSYPSESFLSFCYSCKKNLGQGKDIYMYSGVVFAGVRRHSAAANAGARR
ncbi:FCS-Like Zinc finger 8-like isoform X2 [Salvia miltiorrhiza]|uniref:FCS-Like Zinc finger 8-like isoform X2 n=1 Tax=Salvia miltiorrhiza TaxID=226208 RepID=UPI0025AD0372|nr:FCS-Like Zinc finger 8-like isoform X2 [Salvia miltiorrhiza]